MTAMNLAVAEFARDQGAGTGRQLILVVDQVGLAHQWRIGGARWAARTAVGVLAGTAAGGLLRSRVLDVTA